MARGEGEEIVSRVVDEIRLVYVNVMYLVNEAREDEAKVELVGLLKAQIEAKKLAAKELKRLEKETKAEILEVFEMMKTKGEEQEDVERNERQCVKRVRRASLVETLDGILTE